MILRLACRRKCVVFCVPMTHRSWAEDTTDRIADAVKALRGKRSAQWLADRTKELGHPISRTAISNLEVKRKRSVDVPELVVLARALGVTPLQLLYPDLPSGEVEVLPGHRTSSWSAAQWFAGRGPYEATDKKGKVFLDYADRDNGGRLLQLSLRHDELLKILYRMPTSLTGPNGMVYNQALDTVADQIHDIRREIRDLGGEPLPWVEYWEDGPT